MGELKAYTLEELDTPSKEGPTVEQIIKKVQKKLRKDPKNLYLQQKENFKKNKQIEVNEITHSIKEQMKTVIPRIRQLLYKQPNKNLDPNVVCTASILFLDYESAKRIWERIDNVVASEASTDINKTILQYLSNNLRADSRAPVNINKRPPSNMRERRSPININKPIPFKYISTFLLLPIDIIRTKQIPNKIKYEYELIKFIEHWIKIIQGQSEHF